MRVLVIAVCLWPSLALGANRFWVGGSGTWTDTAHWSASSGGAGGVSAPTASDNCSFDANSFTTTGQTVDNSGTGTKAICNAMNWTGALHSPELLMGPSGNASTIELSGSGTFIAAMTVHRTGGGNDDATLSLVGSGTLTTATHHFGVTLSGTASYTLADDMLCASSDNSCAVSVNDTATLNTANHNVSCFNMGMASGSTLTPGTSTITGFDIVTLAGTVTGTLATVVAIPGTDNVVVTLSGVGVHVGTLHLETVHHFPDHQKLAVTNSAVLDSLVIDAGTVVQMNDFAGVTVGAMTCMGTNSNPIQIYSFNSGTQTVLTIGSTPHCDYVAIMDSDCEGAGSPCDAGTHSVDLGNNTNWTFSPPNNPTWTPTASVTNTPTVTRTPTVTPTPTDTPTPTIPPGCCKYGTTPVPACTPAFPGFQCVDPAIGEAPIDEAFCNSVIHDGGVCTTLIGVGNVNCSPPGDPTGNCVAATFTPAAVPTPTWPGQCVPAPTGTATGTATGTPNGVCVQWTPSPTATFRTPTNTPGPVLTLTHTPTTTPTPVVPPGLPICHVLGPVVKANGGVAKNTLVAFTIPFVQNIHGFIIQPNTESVHTDTSGNLPAGATVIVSAIYDIKVDGAPAVRVNAVAPCPSGFVALNVLFQ